MNRAIYPKSAPTGSLWHDFRPLTRFQNRIRLKSEASLTGRLEIAQFPHFSCQKRSKKLHISQYFRLFRLRVCIYSTEIGTHLSVAAHRLPLPITLNLSFGLICPPNRAHSSRDGHKRSIRGSSGASLVISQTSGRDATRQNSTPPGA